MNDKNDKKILKYLGSIRLAIRHVVHIMPNLKKVYFAEQD